MRLITVAAILINIGCSIASSGALQSQFLNSRVASLPLAARDLPTGTCNADTPCSNKACCSKDGLCGYSPTFCGDGCQHNCDAKAECGQYAPKESQKCPLNVCCSQFGYCGSTSDFCGKGCDDRWGGCGDPKRPSCGGGNSVGKRTIGYYESWASSDSRECQKVSPEDLNLNGFTHINFAFAFFDPESFTIAPMDSNSASLYNRFTGLKGKNQGLQTWISVGGWSFTDPGQTRTAFSDMASSQGNRKKFIDGLTKFMDTYGFDGVDLDWEYPAADDRGGKSEDRGNYVQLAKELRAAFGNKHGISMTLPTSYWYLQHFDLAGIQDSLDWFNLMAYDLHGTWDANSKFVGSYIAPHTNITEIDLGLDLLWRAGVTSDKVVMGQGWYGRSFTLKDPTCSKSNGICEFSRGAKAGACSDASGILDLQEINDILKKSNPKPEYDEKAGVKWITWDSDQWVSYDDDQTFKQKKDFANNRCLGGLMVWAMDQVDQTAPNGLGPVSNVTPEQKKAVDQAGADLDAGATCYTSECHQKCKKNFHEVAQMTGQPGELSTNSRCKKDEHESLCCPNGATMGTCQWRGFRGVGLPCNSGCSDGETEVAKNTNHIDKKLDQSCAGGLQSYCCKGFKPPLPPSTKESVGQKIKDGFDNAGKKIKEGFDDAGKKIKKAFEDFGDDVKNFAEGALLDVASKIACRVAVPALMGAAEAAEAIVPVAGELHGHKKPEKTIVSDQRLTGKGEIADAGEVAVTPAIVAGCQKGLDRLIKASKDKKKPDVNQPKEKPSATRAPPKSHTPPESSPKPSPQDSCKQKRAGGSNPANNQKCNNAKTTTTIWEDTTSTQMLTTGKVCNHKRHTQACYHYRSVIRENPKFRYLTCTLPKHPGRVTGAAVTQYANEHNDVWYTEWAPAKRLGKRQCERDEYPPGYFWHREPGGALAAGQLVRLIPYAENGGAGQLWKAFCEKDPKGGDLKTSTTTTSGNKVTVRNTVSEHWTRQTQVTQKVWSLTFDPQMPNPPDDGLWDNPCWPSTLIPKDPGFALLNDDPWNQKRQVDRAIYAVPPEGAITANKQKPNNKAKRDLGFDPESFLPSGGNATEPAMMDDEEVAQQYGLPLCRNMACLEELRDKGVQEAYYAEAPMVSPPEVEATATAAGLVAPTLTQLQSKPGAVITAALAQVTVAVKA